mmetsp:Transcript_4736/g.9130  ORF Transcript_4736/g.9130 Transcript_4736/m.9130 type:complete len:2126 (+) Transcript_4736:81-6458(+)
MSSPSLRELFSSVNTKLLSKDDMLKFRESVLEVQSNPQALNPLISVCKILSAAGQIDSCKRLFEYIKAKFPNDLAVPYLEKMLTKPGRMSRDRARSNSARNSFNGPTPPSQQRTISARHSHHIRRRSSHDEGQDRHQKKNEFISKLHDYLSKHPMVFYSDMQGSRPVRLSKYDVQELYDCCHTPSLLIHSLRTLSENGVRLTSFEELQEAVSEQEQITGLHRIMQSQYAQSLFTDPELISRLTEDDYKQLIKSAEASNSALGCLRYMLNTDFKPVDSVEDLATALNNIYTATVPARKEALGYFLYSSQCRLLRTAGVSVTSHVIDRIFDDAKAGIFTLSYLKSMGSDGLEFNSVEELIYEVKQRHASYNSTRQKLSKILSENAELFAGGPLEGQQLSTADMDKLIIQTEVGARLPEILQQLRYNHRSFATVDDLIVGVRGVDSGKARVRAAVHKLLQPSENSNIFGFSVSAGVVDKLISDAAAGLVLPNLLASFVTQGLCFFSVDEVIRQCRAELAKIEQDKLAVFNFLASPEQGGKLFNAYAEVSCYTVSTEDLDLICRDCQRSTLSFLKYFVEDSRQFSTANALSIDLTTALNEHQQEVYTFLSRNKEDFFLPAMPLSLLAVRTVVTQGGAGPGTLLAVKQLRYKGLQFATPADLAAAVLNFSGPQDESSGVLAYIVDPSHRNLFSRMTDLKNVDINKDKVDTMVQDLGPPSGSTLVCVKRALRSGVFAREWADLVQECRRTKAEMEVERKEATELVSSFEGLTERQVKETVKNLFIETNGSPSTIHHIRTIRTSADLDSRQLVQKVAALHEEQRKARFKCLSVLRLPIYGVEVVSEEDVARMFDELRAGVGSTSYVRAYLSKAVKFGKGLKRTVDDIIAGALALLNMDKERVLTYLQSNQFQSLVAGTEITAEHVTSLFEEAGSGNRTLAHLQALESSGTRCRSVDFLIKAVAITHQEFLKDCQNVLAYLADSEGGKDLLAPFVPVSEDDITYMFDEARTGYSTLNHLHTLRARMKRFDSLGELIAAIRNLEQGDEIYAFLTGFACEFFAEAPNVVISRSDVDGILVRSPAGPVTSYCINKLSGQGVLFNSQKELEMAVEEFYKADRRKLFQFLTECPHFLTKDFAAAFNLTHVDQMVRETSFPVPKIGALSSKLYEEKKGQEFGSFEELTAAVKKKAQELDGIFVQPPLPDEAFSNMDADTAATGGNFAAGRKKDEEKQKEREAQENARKVAEIEKAEADKKQMEQEAISSLRGYLESKTCTLFADAKPKPKFTDQDILSLLKAGSNDENEIIERCRRGDKKKKRFFKMEYLVKWIKTNEDKEEAEPSVADLPAVLRPISKAVTDQGMLAAFGGGADLQHKTGSSADALQQILDLSRSAESAVANIKVVAAMGFSISSSPQNLVTAVRNVSEEKARILTYMRETSQIFLQAESKKDDVWIELRDLHKPSIVKFCNSRTGKKMVRPPPATARVIKPKDVWYEFPDQASLVAVSSGVDPDAVVFFNPQMHLFSKTRPKSVVKWTEETVYRQRAEIADNEKENGSTFTYQNLASNSTHANIPPNDTVAVIPHDATDVYVQCQDSKNKEPFYFNPFSHKFSSVQPEGDFVPMSEVWYESTDPISNETVFVNFESNAEVRNEPDGLFVRIVQEGDDFNWTPEAVEYLVEGTSNKSAKGRMWQLEGLKALDSQKKVCATIQELVAALNTGQAKDLVRSGSNVAGDNILDKSEQLATAIATAAGPDAEEEDDHEIKEDLADAVHEGNWYNKEVSEHQEVLTLCENRFGSQLFQEFTSITAIGKKLKNTSKQGLSCDPAVFLHFGENVVEGESVVNNLNPSWQKVILPENEITEEVKVEVKDVGPQVKGQEPVMIGFSSLSKADFSSAEDVSKVLETSLLANTGTLILKPSIKYFNTTAGISQAWLQSEAGGNGKVKHIFGANSASCLAELTITVSGVSSELPVALKIFCSSGKKETLVHTTAAKLMFGQDEEEEGVAEEIMPTMFSVVLPTKSLMGGVIDFSKSLVFKLCQQSKGKDVVLGTFGADFFALVQKNGQTNEITGAGGVLGSISVDFQHFSLPEVVKNAANAELKRINAGAYSAEREPELSCITAFLSLMAFKTLRNKVKV